MYGKAFEVWIAQNSIIILQRFSKESENKLEMIALVLNLEIGTSKDTWIGENILLVEKKLFDRLNFAKQKIGSYLEINLKVIKNVKRISFNFQLKKQFCNFKKV